MANSDAGRITLRPPGGGSNQSIHLETLPFESEPPMVGIAGEDFLYHLSRGSELLKDNQVEPAKEALELALSLQPQDVRGQGLLGVVYFRLGLYPRAIDIYQKIIADCPDEIAPKVNLALCYVKTGQQIAARDLLQDVVQREPSHTRAWSYLGLTYQFLHDFGKAYAAFERAGQQGMALRMLRYAEKDEVGVEESLAPERWELRAAAEDACSELETKTSPFQAAEPLELVESDARTGKWHATEPGEEAIPELERLPRRPSTPPPSFRPPPLPSLGGAEFAVGARLPASLQELSLARPGSPQVFLRDWLSEHAPSALSSSVLKIDERSLLVELNEPFAVRANAVALVAPTAVARCELRVLVRSREPDAEAPLGGGQCPIVGYRGPGRLIARTDQGVLELFELDDENVTVRESALFGLSLGLRYEAEYHRFSRGERLEVVRLTGKGFVALALPAQARSVDVTEDGLVVRLCDVVGWTARVLPQRIDPAESPGRSRGYLSLSGAGTVLLG